jgi:peptidyl-tRNA hydrolase, PTH1 family
VRIILGIGNYGGRYKNNRHNVGFMLLDYLAEKFNISFKPSKNDYLFSRGELNKKDFLLIKPVAFVNNSGVAAHQLAEEYSLKPQDMLVVVDDLNLPLAHFRLRVSGGDGGHNGLASIIYHLNSNKFPRIRIGIGQAFEKGNMAGYVLSDLDKNERILLENSFKDAAQLIEEFIHGGIKQLLDANSKLSKPNSNENIAN